VFGVILPVVFIFCDTQVERELNSSSINCKLSRICLASEGGFDPKYFIDFSF